MTDRITMKSVYSCLWQCRDLEISMLWTRLTLLGAFMGLTYAGYGALILKGLDGVRNWEVFNLMAIGASAFGLLFSILWTATAKGSKAWFERYEAMLSYFQETYKDLGLFEKVADVELILSYLDYNKRCIRKRLQPVDSNLFSQNAGAYSVSKIPIAMGQVSMLAWCTIGLVHVWACIQGEEVVRNLVHGRVMYLAVLFVVLTVTCSVMICQSVGSSALKEE